MDCPDCCKVYPLTPIDFIKHRLIIKKILSILTYYTAELKWQREHLETLIQEAIQ